MEQLAESIELSGRLLIEQAAKEVDAILADPYEYIPAKLESYLLKCTEDNPLPENWLQHDMKGFIRQLFIAQFVARKRYPDTATRDAKIVHLQLQGESNDTIVHQLTEIPFSELKRGKREKLQAMCKVAQSNTLKQLKAKDTYCGSNFVEMIRTYMDGELTALPMPVELEADIQAAEDNARSKAIPAHHDQLDARLKVVMPDENAGNRLLLAQYLLGEKVGVTDPELLKALLSTLRTRYQSALLAPLSNSIMTLALDQNDENLINDLTDYDLGKQYTPFDNRLLPESEGKENLEQSRNRVREQILRTIGRIAFYTIP